MNNKTMLAWGVALAWMVAAAPGTLHAQADDGRVHLRNKGSDTMVKVAEAWSRAYGALRPDVVVEVYGGGSGNGLSGLINGHVDLANSSRQIKRKEARLTDKRAREQPQPQVVGRDAVLVLVHPNNPLRGLSFAQLRGIYGRTPRYLKWQELGVTVPGCATGEIHVVSRKNNSGTYAYFRQAVFGRRAHLRSDLYFVGGSEEVMARVATDPCAIGYSGQAYLRESVKPLCLKSSHRGLCAPPPVAGQERSTAYPMIRPLYMYTLGQPEGEAAAYLEWVQGPQGQEILIQSGYLPR